jgi:S1-C subfamily serine protease
LTPSLSVNPTSSVEWKSFGYDAVNKTAWFYSPDTIKSEGNIASVVVRSVADTVQFMPPSLAFKFFYATDYIDCSSNTYVVFGGDAYSENGTLVYAIHPTTNGPILNSSIGSGSLVETLRSNLCAGGRVAAAAAAPSPNAQPEIMSGTAWLGPKGYLITADHVVEGSEKIAIMQGGEIVGSADVVSADPANDVAVLRPRFSRGIHVAMSLSAVPARLGEGVFTLGYPAPDDLGVSLKMTSGEISSLFGEGDDARHLQISIPVQPGNSGGPVVDNSGRVVGIVLARLVETTGKESLENVNYALKADYIQAILGSLPDLGGYSTAQPAVTRSQAINSLQGSVYLIMAARAAKQ